MEVSGAEPGQLRQHFLPIHATDGRRRRVGELDGLVPEDATESEANHGFPQFIAVIDTWITVAVDTHTKYGTWATATHL
jgi:hypothetical protein